MAPRDPTDISLACCGWNYRATFDHDHAPGFPANRFRANVECPGCTSVVILTLTLGPDGAQKIDQEVVA